jgi:hypothetical protein
LEAHAQVTLSADLATLPGVHTSFTKASEDEWADLIDQTWGSGLADDTKLELFDSLWTHVDEEYGAYMNLEVDIDAFRDRYRPEIAAGVSRGRFAAIVNQFAAALKDSHTYFLDMGVNRNTDPQPGVPLFVVGAWLDNSRFGACLTPMEDGTLLVYRVQPGHVLGLEPGDLVLGYDGVPWRDLYHQLLEAELPIHLQWVCGSTDASMDHCMMMSAGLNWHLFDTIDIVKYDTGETVHLSTTPLMSQTGRLLGNEQLPVPGVEMPDYWGGDHISWGIVEGTDIGYIYIQSWSQQHHHQISEQFYEAVHALMFSYDTSGMIIDLRLNTGGGMNEAHDGYALLFDETVREVAFDRRGDPADHFDMVLDSRPLFTASDLTIHGDPATFFDRPIAVLTGPGAVSNGDWETLRTRFHPMVRTFGRPSNGAFTSSEAENVAPYFSITTAIGSGYLLDGHQYLAHTGISPDQVVWLTPDDAARGRDTVVHAAIAWIEGRAMRRPSARRGPVRPR